MKTIPLIFALFLVGECYSGAQVVAGPITNSDNGHLYYLLAATTNWTAMEAQAASLRGHLATIRNANENEWVLSTFRPFYGTTHLFIGLNDPTHQGSFRWVSGETNAYRNWAAGEPNDANGVEHVVEIKVAAGQWNDVQGSGNHYGVIEVLAALTNDMPRVTIARAAGGTGVDLSWMSASNQLYQVLWAPSLGKDGWYAFGTYVYGNGTTVHVLDLINQSQRYYRVIPVQ